MRAEAPSVNPYREKLLSIATPRGVQTKRTVRREKGSVVVTTEHPEGRDVTVTPATVRYRAQIHKTGAKRGQIAGVRLKTEREKKADGQS